MTVLPHQAFITEEVAIEFGCRKKPTKLTSKTHSSDDAHHASGLSARLREIFDFSTRDSSLDKNSMHFLLTKSKSMV
jgi:hypothetical protein